MFISKNGTRWQFPSSIAPPNSLTPQLVDTPLPTDSPPNEFRTAIDMAPHVYPDEVKNPHDVVLEGSKTKMSRHLIFPSILSENPIVSHGARDGVLRPAEPKKLRVVSFNVLCPEYALSTLARERLYRSCPHDFLETSYRLPHCLLELYNAAADCLCLQEVSQLW